jgi:hypothetical protein
MRRVGESTSSSNRQSRARIGDATASRWDIVSQRKAVTRAREFRAHKWRYHFDGPAQFAGRWRRASKHHFGEAIHMKYEKPAVKRFGTIREITLGAGLNTPGDATNLYHRS